MTIGWERKIGYSFVGLMAGNAASLLVFLLIAALQRLDAFVGLARVWRMGIGQAAGMSLLFVIFSLPLWAVVGLPVVLLLRAEITADFYWATAALMGIILGVFGMTLFCVVLDHGFATLRNSVALRTIAPMFVPPALIAGMAFAVYCRLVKAALRRQTKEDGAPKGTPRSLAWFDF